MLEPAPTARVQYEPPVPLELPVPTLRLQAARLLRTSMALAGRLVPAFAGQLVRRRRDNGVTAQAVRQAFERLGATYVKFGQFVGSTPDSRKSRPLKR